MFSAIYNADIARLMTLGSTDFIKHSNKSAAFLCFDHTFRGVNGQTGITGSDTQILDKTAALCDYADLAQRVLSLPEPWVQKGVQRLFAFTVHSGRVCLSRGTFLHGLAAPQRRQSLNEGIMMEVGSFYELYQRSLRQRLWERLHVYCNSSLSVRVFEPCEAAVIGRCDRTECQRRHELDHTWFDKRLRFHMFQITILNLLWFIRMDEAPNLRRFDLLLSNRYLH